MTSKIAYISYPCDVIERPSDWIRGLFEYEQANKDSDIVFHASGGLVSPRMLELLQNKDSNPDSAKLMSTIMAGTYSSRLINSIISTSIEDILSLLEKNPLSTEFLVLKDLWILSRSDFLVLDCGSLGKGRSGIELMYAVNAGLYTIGVGDSPLLDPWSQYHLHCIIKSHSVLEHLSLMSSSEGS